MPSETLMLSSPGVGQALLFSPEIEGIIEAEEAEGKYTAERFQVRRPEAYQAVIQLLGADVGLQRIGKLLGIHHLTAAAVRDREPEAIDTVRSKMVTKLRTAVLLQVERLIEHPELVPYNVSGLIIAQLLDKAELLDGRATQRTEHNQRIDIYRDWNDVVEKVLEVGVLEIEASSSPAGIGLSGENVSAIGALGEVDPAIGDQAASDGESLDSRHLPKESERIDTCSDTDPRLTELTKARVDAHPHSPDREGGEGVPRDSGGAYDQIDSKPPKFLGNGIGPPAPPSLI